MGGFIEKEWLETHRGELERLRGVADELDTIAAVAQKRKEWRNHRADE